MSSRKENAQANVRLAFTKMEWEELKKSEEFIKAWDFAHDRESSKVAVEVGAKILFLDKKWKFTNTQSGKPLPER